MPTIVPLTREAEWLPMLRGLPAWTPPLAPTVVLAPHPDDETLGAGGLIVRLRSNGVRVTVLAITDGEGAYADMEALDRMRVPEQAEALRRLGVDAEDVERLRLPDRELSGATEALEQALLRHAGPETHIVAPWTGDFHPDHEAAGRVAERVSLALGSNLTFYLFWTWHRGSPETLAHERLVRLPITNVERLKKLDALRAHGSQLEHPDGQPILSPELLLPCSRDFEVYLLP